MSEEVVFTLSPSALISKIEASASEEESNSIVSSINDFLGANFRRLIVERRVVPLKGGDFNETGIICHLLNKAGWTTSLTSGEAEVMVCVERKVATPLITPAQIASRVQPMSDDVVAKLTAILEENAAALACGQCVVVKPPLGVNIYKALHYLCEAGWDCELNATCDQVRIKK